MSDVLLVANPSAQSGRNAARVARARELLIAAGANVRTFDTLPGGATIGALAARLSDGTTRTVIAMGGDGTFREVGAALLESGRADHVALAMLPTGTANDQGRSFGLGASEDALPRNVTVACAGHETRLDAGRLDLLDGAGAVLHSEWFFDSAGWGLSARILAERNRDRTLVARLGPLSALYRDHLVYAGALLRVFAESQLVSEKFEARVTVDGRLVDVAEVTDLVIKATRVYGGAWVFDPTSQHDDGAFELVPFRNKREWMSKAIVDLDGSVLSEERLNEIGVSHSRPIRGSRFELSFTAGDGSPLSAQIDGEELPCTPGARVTVVPRALRLIVPAPER